MKLIVSILVCSLLALSCETRQTRIISNELQWTDTLYTNSNDPNFYELKVVVSDSTGDIPPSLKVGEESVIKIEIPKLPRYPILLKANKNVEIIRRDKVNGVFSIVPKDSLIVIEVWQDYGMNHMYQKNQYDSVFSIEKINGPALVQWIEIPVKY